MEKPRHESPLAHAAREAMRLLAAEDSRGLQQIACITRVLHEQWGDHLLTLIHNTQINKKAPLQNHLITQLQELGFIRNGKIRAEVASIWRKAYLNGKGIIDFLNRELSAEEKGTGLLRVPDTSGVTQQVEIPDLGAYAHRVSQVVGHPPVVTHPPSHAAPVDGLAQTKLSPIKAEELPGAACPEGTVEMPVVYADLQRITPDTVELAAQSAGGIPVEPGDVAAWSGEFPQAQNPEKSSKE